MNEELSAVKRFFFKLDPVLRYRRYKERLAQIDLVKARLAVDSKKEQIRQLKESRRDAVIDQKTKEDTGVDVGHHRLYTNFIDGLDIIIESETKVLTELNQEMQKRSDIVKAKTIKRKTLERMEDIEREKYIQWVIQTEQKTMDEIVGLKQKAKEVVS